jgi:IS30 family transposase
VAIETLLRAAYSHASIAAQLRVHRSTISREIKSENPYSGYFATFAHKDATETAPI